MDTLTKLTSYYNPETRVSVMVPEDWTGVQVSPTMFRIFGLPEFGFESHFDEYRVSMSFEMMSFPTLQGDWFETIVQQNNLDMEVEYNAYHLEDETFFELGPHRAYKKHYTWVEENSGLTLFQLQALIYSGPHDLYVVNAAVLEGLKSRYAPIFDSILASTRIIPPKF